MRFINFVTGGDATQMSVSETPMPAPLPHQVLVRVKAFGLNRADTLQRQGKYPPPAGESEILGLEVSGEVVSLGAAVSRWEAGQQVFGLVAGGGYAEYVTVDQDHLMAVPDGLSLEAAAGVAEVFLTAYQSLFWLADVTPGQRVLIHAGASGVGLAATQLAKARGCTVAVTASNRKKLETCIQNGADLAINYHDDDFTHIIKVNWKSADMILDFIGGDYLNRNLKVLSQDGCIVCLAMLGGRYAEKVDMALLLGKRARIIGSTLRNRSDEYKARLTEEFSDECLSLFKDGTLSPNIDSYVDISEVGQAHQRLEDNRTHGKLIGIWS